MKAHISESKRKEVEILKELIGKYKVIGIVDLRDLPSAQMQQIRGQLKDSLLRVTKKRLIRIAIEDAKGKLIGIEKIEEKIKDGKVMPSLIFTNQDSFKLAKLLRNKRTSAAAKPGQISPKEIIIPEGPTPFTPGPIIGELGASGIKAAVEGGKIVVKQDTVLVKEGEEITDKKASLLAKFGIEPMEIGLNLLCTYESGIIYDKKILDVDDKIYIEQIKEISKDAVTLAVEVGYYIKDTAELMIKKSYLQAKSLESGLHIDLTNVQEEKHKEKIVIDEKPRESKTEIIDEAPKIKRDIIREARAEERTDKKEKKPSAVDIVHEISEKIREEKIYEEKRKKEEEAKRVPSASELAKRKTEKGE